MGGLPHSFKFPKALRRTLQAGFRCAEQLSLQFVKHTSHQTDMEPKKVSSMAVCLQQQHLHVQLHQTASSALTQRQLRHNSISKPVSTATAHHCTGTPSHQHLRCMACNAYCCCCQQMSYTAFAAHAASPTTTQCMPVCWKGLFCIENSLKRIGWMSYSATGHTPS